MTQSRVPLGSLSLAFFLCLGCLPKSSEHSAPPPNLLLVSVDTLRADHLSLYGYPRETSPFLEQLAEESIVFDQFFHSGGGTLPSHLSLLTSLSPAVHGIGPHNPVRLPDEITTLSEYLKKEGYSTAAFTDGGWMDGRYGFDQGFDIYDDDDKYFRNKLARINDFIAEQSPEDPPFFLFIHTYEVHSKTKKLPYGCGPEYNELFAPSNPVEFDGCKFGKCATKMLLEVNNRISEGETDPDLLITEGELAHLESLYDGCIRFVDDILKGLLENLQQRGLLENTMVVVTSDHGEEFMDHGMLIHNQGGWEEMIHLPLLIRLPHAQPGQGKRISQIATTIDVLPTLLTYLGIEFGEDLQGQSLKRAIDEDLRVRRYATLSGTIRSEEWKYFPKRGELYHLPTDPEEKLSVSEKHPSIVEEHHQAYDAFLDHSRSWKEYIEKKAESLQEVNLSKADIENLQALGYLQ